MPISLLRKAVRADTAALRKGRMSSKASAFAAACLFGMTRKGHRRTAFAREPKRVGSRPEEVAVKKFIGALVSFAVVTTGLVVAGLAPDVGPKADVAAVKAAEAKAAPGNKIIAV